MIDTVRPGESFESTCGILHLEADLCGRFDAIEARLADRPSLARYILPSVQEQREELVHNEKVFIERVVDAVRGYDVEQRPLVLLFDIDETLMKKMLDHEGTDILRPAVGPLLRYLKKTYGERIHLGLLSSRGQQSVEAVASSRAFFDDAGDSTLDSRFIESSRDGMVVERLGGRMTFAYKKDGEVLNELEPYLSPEVRAIRDNIGERGQDDIDLALTLALGARFRLGSVRDPKLAVMAEFSLRNPSATYILVDDLPIVEVLGGSNVHGVSVYEQGRFSFV